MDTLSAVSAQVVDLGFDRAHLEFYLARCGYWGDASRRKRHDYVLSPSVYVLSAQQEAQVERLAKATYAAVRTLNQKLCASARKPYPSSHEEALLLRFANSASRGLLRPHDGEADIPPVFKVDLVQDALGRFFIVEADVYNPRGYGYAAMLEESISKVSYARRFPGIEGLRQLLYSSGVRDQPLYVLVSEYERYYETMFGILCEALSRRGMDARLIRDRDLVGRSIDLDGSLFALPDTLDKFPEVRGALLGQYRRGALRTVYPVVSYLGSKAFLPFLREQDGMDEFIPPTTLVSKKHNGWIPMCGSGRPLVLKAHVSAGMKGVLFSDLDPQAFDDRLAQARSVRDPSWILQEQVPQVATPVVVFDEQGNRRIDDYYLRLVAFVTADGVLDIEVTGRPDRKVHGAPDCIQLPVVLS